MLGVLTAGRLGGVIALLADESSVMFDSCGFLGR